MKTNIEYFEYSKNNPEELFDESYQKNKVVIPPVKNESNTLTHNNEKLISLISTYDTLVCDYKKDINDDTVKQVVLDVINILDKTKHINYSAFVQFFMAKNANFSIYKSLEKEYKAKFIFDMLKKYCEERHHIYMNHGYSNIVLQVLCDGYSHKGNGKVGINKNVKLLESYNVKRIRDISKIEEDDYYFLADKGDEKLFEDFLIFYDVKMQSREIEHKKRPDIVFKHNGHIYICEVKSMKGSGGGQDKQAVEFSNFINFSEKNEKIHYITFLDCEYANRIFSSNRPKITEQRNSIIQSLKNNIGNYFLNTKGMELFLKELFKQA